MHCTYARTHAPFPSCLIFIMHPRSTHHYLYYLSPEIFGKPNPPLLIASKLSEFHLGDARVNSLFCPTSLMQAPSCAVPSRSRPSRKRRNRWACQRSIPVSNDYLSSVYFVLWKCLVISVHVTLAWCRVLVFTLKFIWEYTFVSKLLVVITSIMLLEHPL